MLIIFIMFIIPTSGDIEFNTMVISGLYWKSKLQINQYKFHFDCNFKTKLLNFLKMTTPFCYFEFNNVWNQK
jgi:hypothetical protein